MKWHKDKRIQATVVLVAAAVVIYLAFWWLGSSDEPAPLPEPPAVVTP